MNTEKLKDLHLGNRLKEKLDELPHGSVQKLSDHMEMTRQALSNKFSVEDFKLKDLVRMLEFLNMPLDEFLGVENAKSILSERYQKGLEIEQIERWFASIDQKLDECLQTKKVGTNAGQPA